MVNADHRIFSVQWQADFIAAASTGCAEVVVEEPSDEVSV